MPNAKPICTVVIPAHNEEAVLASTLRALLQNALFGEFDLIVACNGCTDHTVSVALEAAPDATILEIASASKTKALNAAIRAADKMPVVFLDADIQVSALAVRNMVHRLNWSGAYLAYGNATFNTSGCSWAVKAFYSAWQLNPYFDQKKMGAFFAISKSGLDVLGRFPNVLSDDEFVRRKLISNSACVENANYQIEAPRSLKSLIKVRSRIYRGNATLSASGTGFAANTKAANALLFMRRILSSPKTWPGALIFVITAMAAHLRNALLPTGRGWDRDLTTRQPATEGK